MAKTEYSVGDRVAFRYVDVIDGGTLHSTQPIVDGVIVSLPRKGTRGRNAFYEVTVDDDALRAAGCDVVEEAEGLPHYVADADIMCVLPSTMERTDVEAWLEA